MMCAGDHAAAGPLELVGAGPLGRVYRSFGMREQV
jgi:hypothetical protein